MAISRATIKSIAADCGVSTQTVSRIVNGMESLHKPETVRLVREAMKRAGFLPDSSARSMRSGRTGVVALLQQAGSASYLPYQLLDGVSERLESLGFQLNFARLELANDGSVSSFPKILKERRADALLVNINDRLSPALEEEIASKGFPSVWINVDRPFDGVRPDDFEASRRAARHLASRGAGGVFYIHSTFSRHCSARERLEGARSFCEEAGLSFDSLSCEEGTGSLSQAVVAERFRRVGLPSAILGYTVESLALAVGALASIVGYEAALKPPRAVFGPASADSSLLPSPFLEIPFKRMGVEAVERVVAKLSGATEPFPSVKIPYSGDFAVFEA